MENRRFTHCVHCEKKLREINNDWKYRHLHKKCYKQLNDVLYLYRMQRSESDDELCKAVMTSLIEDIKRDLDINNHL